MRDMKRKSLDFDQNLINKRNFVQENQQRVLNWKDEIHHKIFHDPN